MSTHTHTADTVPAKSFLPPPDCFHLQLQLAACFRLFFTNREGAGGTSCVPVVDIATPAVGLLINTANT